MNRVFQVHIAQGSSINYRIRVQFFKDGILMRTKYYSEEQQCGLGLAVTLWVMQGKVVEDGA